MKVIIKFDGIRHSSKAFKVANELKDNALGRNILELLGLKLMPFSVSTDSGISNEFATVGGGYAMTILAASESSIELEFVILEEAAGDRN